MPAAIVIPVRRALWQRHLRGQSPARIANDLGLSLRTVQHLLHRLQQHGLEGLSPSYRAPATRGWAAALASEALQLRQQHPTWGAGLIRIFLQQAHPGERLASERTLQRWFHAAGLGPAPVGHQPRGDQRRADHVHEVWQVDAKEHVRLRDGQEVCWLRTMDECSGAVLDTAVFPPGALGQHGPRSRAGVWAPGL